MILHWRIDLQYLLIFTLFVFANPVFARTTSSSVTQVELDKIPTARDPWAVLQTVPGVHIDRINTGGNESGQKSYFSGSGSASSDNTFAIDGVIISDMAAIGASPTYYDFDAFEDIAVTTGVPDASLATSGITLNLVTKRGTNEWRGSGRFIVADDHWSSIIDWSGPGDTDSGSDAEFDSDQLAADLGGALVKDKLWFFGTYGGLDRMNDYADGADDKSLKNYVSETYTGISGTSNSSATFFNYGDKPKSGRSVGVTRPQETAWNQKGPSPIYKIEDQHIIGSNTVIVAKFSYIGGGFAVVTKPVNDILGNTGVGDFSDASGAWGFNPAQPNRQYNFDGSYFLNTGAIDHEFTLGFAYREAVSDGSEAWPTTGLTSDDSEAWPTFKPNFGRYFYPAGPNVLSGLGFGREQQKSADTAAKPIHVIQTPTDLTLQRLPASFGAGEGPFYATGEAVRMQNHAWTHAGNWQTITAMGYTQKVISLTGPTWLEGEAIYAADDSLFLSPGGTTNRYDAAAVQKAIAKPADKQCRPSFQDGLRHGGQRWMLIHARQGDNDKMIITLDLNGPKPTWSELNTDGSVAYMGYGLRYDAAGKLLWLYGGHSPKNKRPIYTLLIDHVVLNWLGLTDAAKPYDTSSNPLRVCGGIEVHAPAVIPELAVAAPVASAWQFEVCDSLHDAAPARVVELALASAGHIRGTGLTCFPGAPQSETNQQRQNLSLQDPTKSYHPLFNPLTMQCTCS